MPSVSRRSFLLSATTLVGAAVATLAATRAFGLSLEESNAETDALIRNACTARNQYHAQLLAELESRLSGHPPAEIQAAVAAATCPLCGCPIG
jgi:hypothetical protein